MKYFGVRYVIIRIKIYRIFEGLVLSQPYYVEKIFKTFSRIIIALLKH
jgi:hypothetical protein